MADSQFTSTALGAIRLAQENAARLGHSYVGSEHLLLGLAGQEFSPAAMALRRAGADTYEVRRYFQSDLTSMIQRYEIIREAQMVHGDIALAVARSEVDRVTAAKTADDLLNLQGVQASIVLYRQGDGVSMSGRSLGEVNVQVILERLGGGGNATAAGGHVSGADLYAVRQRVAEAIEDYYAP